MNQRTLTIILIILGSLFGVALILLVLFGWQLAASNTQKKNEISTNLSKQEKALNAAFQVEREKVTTTYTADEVFGAFEFTYPKVWSTNVRQEAGASEELVFLADPKLIAVNKDAAGPYTALRVKVYQDKYDAVVKDIENRLIKNVKDPYTEKTVVVSGLNGKQFVGKDSKSGKTVTFALIPLRDKTLYIGTDDSTAFQKNYDTILKTFKISK